MEELRNNKWLAQTTADGSTTLIDRELGASFHSKFGAVTESQHVFIAHGLDYYFKNTVDTCHLLEFGFGTGLNALLTWRYARAHKKRIHFTTLEKFPISEKEANSLDFGNKEIDQAELRELHNCKWSQPQSLDSYFTIQKRQLDFKTIAKEEAVDLIYYDAFAPDLQPDLWDAPHLRTIFQNLKPGGIFITYCAKGSFRRTLRSLPVHIDNLPGPPGKREITRALKSKIEL